MKLVCEGRIRRRHKHTSRSEQGSAGCGLSDGRGYGTDLAKQLDRARHVFALLFRFALKRIPNKFGFYRCHSMICHMFKPCYACAGAHKLHPEVAYDGLLGIATCTGDYIAYLDDDDAFLPEHIEKLVGLLEKRQVDFVFSQMQRYVNGVPEQLIV